MKEESKGFMKKEEIKFWFAILVLILSAATAFLTLRGRVLAVETENDRLSGSFTMHMETVSEQLKDISDKINNGNVEQAKMKKDIEFIRETIENGGI